MGGVGLQGNDKATRVATGTERLDPPKSNQLLIPTDLVCATAWCCVVRGMACANAGKVVISHLGVGACAWGFEAPAAAPGPQTSPCAALPGCLGDDTSLAVWDWAGERVPSYLDCCSGPASKCNGALTG